MKKVIKIVLILLTLVLTVGVLFACNPITESTAEYKITLQNTKKIEFTLGSVDLSEIKLRLLDKNSNLVENFVTTSEMLSTEDFKKLNKEGVHAITVRYKDAMLILTVYIVKAPIKTVFTVTYHSNGGTDVSSIETDIITTLPYTEKTAFKFNGWYFDSNFLGDKVIPPYTLTKNVDLYAEWLDEDAFKVRFYDRYNMVIDTQYVERGKSAKPPTMSDYTGHIFKGWKIDLWQNVQKDLEIYPDYQKEVYNIIFIDEDRTQVGEPFSVKYNENFDSTLEPSVPEKFGYTGKWVDSESGVAPVYRSISRNMTIKPLYTKKSYIITFVNADQSFRETKVVEHGGNLSANDIYIVPPVDGNIGKWMRDNDGILSEPSYFNIIEDMKILATYTKKNYSITFKHQSNDNILTLNVDYGDVIAANSIPTLEAVNTAVNGKYNDGTWNMTWHKISTDDGKPIDFTKVENRTFKDPTKDNGYKYEYFAVFTRKPLTVEFKIPLKDIDGQDIYGNMGGTLITTQTVKYNNQAEEPNLPAAIALRYEFDGVSSKWTQSTVNITKDMTGDNAIFAKLKLKKFKVEFYNWEFNLSTTTGKYILIEDATKTYNYEQVISSGDLPSLTAPNGGEGELAIKFEQSGWIQIDSNGKETVIAPISYTVTTNMKIYPKYISDNIGTSGLKFEEYNTGFKVVGFEANEDFIPGDEITIIVPNVYNTKNVIAIGKGAFNGVGSDIYSNNIVEIKILKNVLEIDDGAFDGCTNLAKISLEDNNNFAFVDNILYDKTKSKIIRATSVVISVTIPNTVTELTEGSFSGCRNLTSIIFEATSILTKIADNTFKGCSELAAINLPSSLTSVGDSAFALCYKLDNITIGNSSILSDIKANSFSDTKWYISYKGEFLILGDTLIKYNYKDKDATSVIVIDNVRYIIDGVFSGKTKLKSISFSASSSLEYLGNNLFTGCIELNTFNILCDRKVTATDKTFSGILLSSILTVHENQVEAYAKDTNFATFHQK